MMLFSAFSDRRPLPVLVHDEACAVIGGAMGRTALGVMVLDLFYRPTDLRGGGLGHALPAGAIVLLGMVGYFAGVVQGPITAVIIVMEMTANQGMTIPLLATATLAYATSRLVCRRPRYGALARRFLRGLG